MGSEITLFSGYSQKENRTTNYCLLVLKLVYEENPKLLGETLSALVGEAVADAVGVVFRQQVKRGDGIPDGLIWQQALHVHIETKNFDWFYDDQLERHLDALGQEMGTRVLLALSNFESKEQSRFARIQRLCEGKFRGKLFFTAVGFDDFVAALPRNGVSKRLLDTFADFEQYLDEEGLLPRWKNLLDVINCSGLPREVAEHGVYMCPAMGGAYAHSRAKYFGMYANKTVGLVATIEAVVEVGADGEAQVKWRNVDRPAAEVTRIAVDKRRELRPDEEGPLRVFVLGRLHETDFRKTSSGGMQQSKRYFDVSEFGVKDADELARALRDRTWE